MSVFSDELRLWLIGSGIKDSPSPAMQEAALRACGRHGRYEIVDAEPSDLPGLVDRMRAGEVRGANVTVPYKGALAAACDELVGDAVLCGVVNTITVENGRLIGANTDARGFELGLAAHQLEVGAGSRVVVIGGGGVAAACALGLSRARAQVVLCARQGDQAAAICQQSGWLGLTRPVEWRSPELGQALADASLVVNATSAGLDAMPFTIADLATGCAVADVRYRPRPVDLVAAARASGRSACDGVEMLLHQGMLAFGGWTGQTPPWSAARDALRQALGA